MYISNERLNELFVFDRNTLRLDPVGDVQYVQMPELGGGCIIDGAAIPLVSIRYALMIGKGVTPKLTVDMIDFQFALEANAKLPEYQSKNILKGVL